jgi:site-specific DNA recombinase
MRAKTLDVRERQQILRLLVKEILVDTQSLTIRHSIPISHTQKSFSPSGSSTTQPLPSTAPQPPSYLLRPWSNRPITSNDYCSNESNDAVEVIGEAVAERLSEPAVKTEFPRSKVSS